MAVSLVVVIVACVVVVVVGGVVGCRCVDAPLIVFHFDYDYCILFFLSSNN